MLLLFKFLCLGECLASCRRELLSLLMFIRKDSLVSFFLLWLHSSLAILCGRSTLCRWCKPYLLPWSFTIRTIIHFALRGTYHCFIHSLLSGCLFLLCYLYLTLLLRSLVAQRLEVNTGKLELRLNARKILQDELLTRSLINRAGWEVKHLKFVAFKFPL